MTPRQAEVVAAVDEYGSVPAAARVLGVSHQTIYVTLRRATRTASAPRTAGPGRIVQVLGPVPCQGCRRSVVLADRSGIPSSRVWRDAATDRRHICRERAA